jgi:hypothetical protein
LFGVRHLVFWVIGRINLLRIALDFVSHLHSFYVNIPIRKPAGDCALYDS